MYNRLKNLGFDIKKEEIFSSLAAARQTIIKRCLNPYLLIDSAAMEDFEDLIKVEKQYDSVVIGLAPEKFNYDDLNNAFRYRQLCEKIIFLFKEEKLFFL